ncbi:leucine--tRNA ligase [Segetibacter aerophilus]|uniref:Leucine--tRNA ligase n=1 Tax=Segetibacter aerophilus TaxID=670293 RepID=A0A512BIU5_9BACT|nr:leucine--tRNA ligase [Segetibacter aerophilus]GEO11737.1 leucine--tRNA ligase [Segetibacter aerophilus]
MEYNFREIEKRWQQQWRDSGAYRVSNESDKPKFYVLDMFPYPSGAGLHVGHPLGYIASDIYARFKRLKGYNVLHPMGFDSFGLPAEQYALETGQHPAVTTEKNIARYKEQLDNIGFCYDWSREVRTSDPKYYKWTQWIFLQLFDSWYNRKSQKAERINVLEGIFEKEGNVTNECPGDRKLQFIAEEWSGFDNQRQQEILMDYRLAFSAFGEVNWCEALGTVLANDEVVNGVSERGGHPVVKKKMRQWYLRITEYADRLLQGLEQVDFSDSMKEMQRNWIGKSQGAEVRFKVKSEKGEVEQMVVYTTRPDTMFGVDFMVVAPEHEMVSDITSFQQKDEISKYLEYVKSRSERERLAEVKSITGAFTGAYAINPFDGREIPIWISEYVLAGYGTGAIMAVPCGDQRDFAFAKHFNIPITNIIGEAFNGEEANPTKDAILQNSDFLDGMVMRDAINVVIDKLEEMGIGKRQVNYRMRDAGFSRQRYWGEPFPIVYKGGVAFALDEGHLPVELPYVDTYSAGPEGEGPLANLADWIIAPGGGTREANTMPGYAGSSWYFLRYMDPQNEQAFADRKATDYWNQVDLYIGGTEHAVGHLLYSRLWTKVLFDLGYIGHEEPYKKLVNQGMIQGSSRFVYRIKSSNQFVSAGLIDQYETDKVHVHVGLVDGLELDIESFKNSRPEYEKAEFILEDGKYVCGAEVEKMSKSKYNVVNPDEIVERYGADTFRMYEMFLGPVEQSKPWDTKGIEGVHRFLRKFWRLFVDETKGLIVTNDAATPAELKVLHRTIKKIEEDTERFSFNTAVSAFMVCVNELNDLKSRKKEVLQPLLILLTSYAPHVSEELWKLLGNEGSVLDAAFPKFEEKYLVESSKEYPVSINGKHRTNINISLDAAQPEVEQIVVANEIVQKWLEGKAPKKIIFVKGRMINVVI